MESVNACQILEEIGQLYPCRNGSVGKSDVVDTDLMYSIRYICQIGGKDESRIYTPRPFRMICLRSGYVLALHTVRVDLGHITIRSSRIDLDCVGNLVAIHGLREMDLELDAFRRDKTIIVPWEKAGNHGSRRYEFIDWDEHFVAPSSKCDLGNATSKWLLGVIA